MKFGVAIFSKQGAYCTIVAKNYLPQAKILIESVQRCEPTRKFICLVIDEEFETEVVEGNHSNVSFVSPRVLGLTKNEIFELATIYSVVEFATAVKPLFLKHLLEQHNYAVYLDPDMQVVSPLLEIEEELSKSEILLTPHLLNPVSESGSGIIEINLLRHGIHNLGFCAVGQGSNTFLDWWWGHLKRQCLDYPLMNLYTDQKWTDAGAVFFEAATFRHAGYNVAPWNLHERHIVDKEGELFIAETGEPLRLLHFSNADPQQTNEMRANLESRKGENGQQIWDELKLAYVENLLKNRSDARFNVQYKYNFDSNGRKISKRTRQLYRALTAESAVALPSPFIKDDKKSFSIWKRKSFTKRIVITFGDVFLALKYAFPDAKATLKKLSPKTFISLLGRAGSSQNLHH